MFARRVILAFSLALCAQAAKDNRLNTAIVLDTPTTGASTTPEGRTFLKLAHVDGTTGAQIGEVIGNGQGHKKIVAYPNDDWNSWNATVDSQKDSENKFVSANAQRIGPDGKLWVVDSGSLDKFSNSSKLISFDLETDKVDRVYYLSDITTKAGSINDIRFNGKNAYLSEYTEGSLIILELESGKARRVLKGHKSTVALMPSSADGEFIRTASDGKLAFNNADQLEVSPDGKYLYYQPGSGNLWRIETKYLDAALHDSTAAESLPDYVEPFALTGSTGGSAIDANGNIYWSDGDRHSVTKIDETGKSTLLVQDDRLEWVDAMWIDNKQKLWLCASQLTRGSTYLQPNNQSNTIEKPIYVYTLDIGVGPSPIDHE